MANYRDNDALAKDIERVRRTATFLLNLPDAEWSDWELDFLEGMAECSRVLSTRQAEKLAELRDDAIRYISASGFKLATIIDRCWRNRYDLDDQDDVEFIERLKARGETALRRGAALHLRDCAVALGEIEPHQPWVLGSPAF